MFKKISLLINQLKERAPVNIKVLDNIIFVVLLLLLILPPLTKAFYKNPSQLRAKLYSVRLKDVSFVADEKTVTCSFRIHNGGFKVMKSLVACNWTAGENGYIKTQDFYDLNISPNSSVKRTLTAPFSGKWILGPKAKVVLSVYYKLPE